MNSIHHEGHEEHEAGEDSEEGDFFLLLRLRDIEEAFESDQDYHVVWALRALTGDKMRLTGIPFHSLTLSEKIALTIPIFDAEVCNGGFHQFFLNYSGDYYVDTLEALKAIEANHATCLLEQAISVFPVGIPSIEWAERNEQVRQLSQDSLELLHSLTHEFYESSEDIFALAAEYLRPRKADFL
jgi:hypothetical protein